MAFLDGLFGWLLVMDPALAVPLIALIVSILISLALKAFTDQSLMKDLREELKELQKQMKNLQSNPKKMAKINSQFMETNMKYMSHSMRPTLFTLLPMLLIFGWLNSHMGYYPLVSEQPFELTADFDRGIAGDITLLVPDELGILNEDSDGVQEQTVTIVANEASWKIEGPPGDYQLTAQYLGQNYTKQVTISNDREYAPVTQSFMKGFLFWRSSSDGLRSLTLSNEQIIPFENLPIPWLNTWGWLGIYIVFSIIFSMVLRRLLKIY